MNSLILNRGSTVDFSLVWPDGAGGTANLTGFTVDAFEPHANLAAHLTLTLVDAATGLISGRIVWDDAMPDGSFMTFRIRVSGGGGVTTTNRLQVTVQ